jgi:DNA-binding transcriptional MerR regulator
MGAHQPITPDPLLAGFYTMKDVARLLRTPNSARLRGWLNGWPNSQSGPVVLRDFNGTSTVSFFDLIELRFIEHFRSAGVTMPTIRRAVATAREQWGSNHPLALSKAKYLTDRRKVFEQAAEEEGDERTIDLVTRQYELWNTIEQTIEHGLTFDPSTYMARRWRPSVERFPNVIVDPAVAFGAPSMESAGVPTAALYKQYQAESGRGGYARVAKWFNVPEQIVVEAVKFEISLT